MLWPVHSAQRCAFIALDHFRVLQPFERVEIETAKGEIKIVLKVYEEIVYPWLAFGAILGLLEHFQHLSGSGRSGKRKETFACLHGNEFLAHLSRKLHGHANAHIHGSWRGLGFLAGLYFLRIALLALGVPFHHFLQIISKQQVFVVVFHNPFIRHPFVPAVFPAKVVYQEGARAGGGCGPLLQHLCRVDEAVVVRKDLLSLIKLKGH
mmetsp:Transcript_15610/g.39912  ORF Transcript_15610/g.39912 Transcript_15610/m.39912 type:complete len:208 (-) Transcript_15610:22-645(-)